MFLTDPTDYDMGFGPKLWDATPGVCCAAFQLGACEHTESFDPFDDETDLADARAEHEAIMSTVIEHDEPF